MEHFIPLNRMKYMPRTRRQHYEGAVYHAMARGNGGQDVFLGKNDYERFLYLLSRQKKLHGLKLFAYCLMPNHFHLLVQVGSIPLSTVMQCLLTVYAKGFNARWHKEGHVFYERYKALSCRDDAYLVTLVRYIHLNPVKAGLAFSPEDWPWSSHKAYLGEISGVVDTGLVLSILGGESEYRKFFGETPLEEVSSQHEPFPEQPRRASLVELQRTSAAKRDLIAAALEAGYGPVEIAAFLDCTPQAISNARRRARVTSKPGTDVTSAAA